MLVPDCSAKETYLICKGHIISYMRENFQAWCTLANETERLALKEEEILFVSSVTKTKHWFVASFDNSTREREGSLSVEFNDTLSARIQGDNKDTHMQGIMYKSGPPRSPHAVR